LLSRNTRLCAASSRLLSSKNGRRGGPQMGSKTSPLAPHSRRASARPLVMFAACATGALVASVALAQQPTPVQPPKGQQGPVVPPGSLTFNTVITKLKAGKQVFSNTISKPDLEAAKKACVGQDFIWIEMQHSTLTWRETQQLIKVIAEAGCIPFVR